MTAHIIGRSYSGTRCQEDNAWCLCPSCHVKVDDFHDEKARLVESTIGPIRYSRMVVLARDGVGMKHARQFWVDEVDRLKARCVELGLDTRRRIPA